MSLRCGCAAEGDEIVFGPAHECSKDPIQYQKPDTWFQHPRPYEHVLSDDAEPGDLG